MIDEGLSDATWIAGVLALCGTKLGGALIADDAVESFIAAYTTASQIKPRQVPSSMSSDVLSGSLDLAATLALGKPVQTPGLIAKGSHAFLLVNRAERLDAACTSLIAQGLDRDEVLLLAVMNPNDPDASFAEKLAERLPFRVETKAAAHWTQEDIALARKVMKPKEFDSKLLQDLCATALSIGITSPRAILQAVTTARAIAALQGLKKIDEASVALAAKLTLAHRALYAPPSEQENEESQPPPPSSQEVHKTEEQQTSKPQDAEVILEAVKMALPPHLLQTLRDGLGKKGVGRNVKSNAPKKSSSQRGRRIGNKRASSLARQRLDIIATLRCSAYAIKAMPISVKNVPSTPKKPT